MPKDRLEKARFERVSETGDLVFSLGGRQFAVSLDDTLERAILEAKQIRSEQQQPEQPHEQSTLPISQIQSLIRAGADPSRVAERYGLSTTLVRRFSAAVETEKQYAIEQFLTVPAPKDSKVRTINELVERTLAAASIGMESVTWKSTRRGLEPWHIVAIFTSAGREIHAEWTWNMHDNSVVCLNNAARKLLGEQNPRTENAGGAKASPEPALPGDSVRSARIERAVSAWAAPKPSAPQTRPASSNPVTSTGSMPPIDLSASGSMPPVKLSAPVSTGARVRRRRPMTAGFRLPNPMPRSMTKSPPIPVRRQWKPAKPQKRNRPQHPPKQLRRNPLRSRPEGSRDARRCPAGMRFCSATDYSLYLA